KLNLPALKMLARKLIRDKQDRITELEQHPETVFNPDWDRPRIEYWIDFLNREYDAKCNNLSAVIRLRSQLWNNKTQRAWEYNALLALWRELEGMSKTKREIKGFWKAIRTMYNLAEMPIEEDWPEGLKQSPA